MPHGLGTRAAIPAVASLRRAEDVTRLLDALYGESFAAAPPGGVLHVAAAYRPAGPPGGQRRNLLINERSPKNPYDAFALLAARARADAIVTTGRILRDEPGVRYTRAAAEAMVGPDAAAALEAWRGEVARPAAPEPTLLVLTTGGADFPLGHGVFERAAPCVVLCPAAAAGRLEADPRRRANVEICPAEAPGIGAAVELLRARGCRSVLIEAGPSTSRELYCDSGAAGGTAEGGGAPAAGVRVTELLLTTLHEGAAPVLHDSCRGAEFVPDEAVARTLARSGPEVLPAVPSEVAWTFQRLTA